MKAKRTKSHPMSTVSERVRRQLAAKYRALAQKARYTPAERAEFARMAASWESTLPKEK